jgi:hypothetical protein
MRLHPRDNLGGGLLIDDEGTDGHISVSLVITGRL